MADKVNNRKIKVEHFKNLVAVAYSDGFYDEIERDFLAQKAIEYGLSTQMVSTILSNAENLQFIVPENSIDSEDQLSDIVYMAIIDGVLRKDEYQLCLNIAERLGFSKSHVDKVIEISKKSWNKKNSEI